MHPEEPLIAAKDSARGKALELHVGRLLGGRRRRNGEGIGFDDCILPDGRPLAVSIECKAYAVLQLQKKWVEQARRNSGGRPWAIVQRPKGSKTIYATVDFEWLLELLGLAGITTTRPEGQHDGREAQD